MSRKAQAAMEFLMTYGWAILVVLVVLGALTYFGVLSPQTLLPSRCETGETWLKCKDYALSASRNEAQITLGNNWQYDVKVTSLYIESIAAGIDCEDTTLTTTISQAEEETLTIVCDLPDSRVGKGKVRSDITVGWERADVSTPIKHNMTGVLIAQIE